MRVLVIGYGNPLRSDDALGWRVAEELRTRFEQELSDNSEATASASAAVLDVITCQQLNPELADPISRAKLVLFVDASDPAVLTTSAGSGRVGSHSGTAVSATAAAGTIIEEDLEPACQSPQCFSHDLTPSTLLACAGELFGSCPKAKLLSIVGADFAMGETLSPAVEASLPELLRRIEKLLAAASYE